MKYFITCLVFLTLNATAKIKVAVIDTGIDSFSLQNKTKRGLCETGHKDFTGTGLVDNYGHGTNVSGIIHKYANNSNYCQIIYKFWNNETTLESVHKLIRAINAAIDAKVDVINLSLSGTYQVKEEREAIINALDKGIVVIAAAGNQGKLLRKCISGQDCLTAAYPAMYDLRIITVGSLDKHGNISLFSNRGPEVDVWEIGEQVQGSYGRVMSGTSQATAKYTGKYISK